MAESTRDALAKVFYPTKERLEATIEVSKSSNKKKKLHLVVTVSIEKPANIQIYLVKKTERNEWKKKLICNSHQLRQLDCHDSPNLPSYDLEFRCEGKHTRLFALRLDDKRHFVELLYRVILHHQPHICRGIEFLNIHDSIVLDGKVGSGGGLDDFSESTDDGRDRERTSENSSGPAEAAYQTLTKREEDDMNRFLNETSDPLINAVAFMEKLTQHMLDVEGTNIHSIMASEDQVAKLMSTLDLAIDQIELMENKVNVYNLFISEIEGSMACLSDRDELLQLTQENSRRLLTTLEELNGKLSLDTDKMRALMEVDLRSSQGVARCTEAALKLDALVRERVPEGLEQMRAVEDKTQEFQRVRDTFAQKLATHVNDTLHRLVNEFTIVLNKGGAGLGPQGHSSVKRDLLLGLHEAKRAELMELATLMAWLKMNRESVYVELRRLYCEKMGGVFQREIKEFLESAKMRLALKVAPSMKMSDSSSSLNTPNWSRNGSKMAIDPSSESVASSDMTSAFTGNMLPKFDIIFEEVLTKLKPLVFSEEKFVTEFFRLNDTSSRTGEDKTAPATTAVDGPTGVDPIDCLQVLFNGLDRDLVDMMSACEQANRANTMPMFVVVNRQLDQETMRCSFLAKVWAVAIIESKRAFKRHIEQLVQSFRDYRPSKKSRCGILPIVKSYEIFAENSLQAFQESSRKVDLDRAHSLLVDGLRNEIDRISLESAKTPREVVIMENYHRLSDILRRLKLTSLDEMRKEVTRTYQQALAEYTTNAMGRPFEKLHTFFERVQQALDSGVKNEAIGYQFAFSRQELKKVIKEYPGKEVKRGLEQLSKKVEKHLSEEENLFQVVWRSVQAEFMKLCGYYENLIQLCYPDTNIALEFTLQDLEHYFSEIAKSR